MPAKVISARETEDQCRRDSGCQFFCKRVGVSACENDTQVKEQECLFVIKAFFVGHLPPSHLGGAVSNMVCSYKKVIK